ncbi:right-handed parallel beta-helix repeat-containing protein, partial [bacterium]|nr:right-handed parallel beta-helix repeat-containing protein [bacterium]
MLQRGRRALRWLVVGTLLLASGAGSASAFTFLVDDMPDTLHASESPYVALTALVMNGGESCYAEPGVTLFFTEGTGLQVRSTATLELAGQPGTPVIFEGYQGAPWDGIELRNAPGPVFSARWCEFRDAGRTVLAFENGGYDVLVQDCIIDAAQGLHGIYLLDTSGTYSSFAIERTVVSGANDTGIFVQKTSSDLAVVTDCEVSGCGTGLRLSGGVATGIEAHGNSTGVVLSGSLFASVVRGNQTGVSGGGIVEDCDVFNNDVGFRATSGSGRVNNCRIYGNAVYAVQTTAGISQFTTVDFRYNVWSNATTAEMQAEGTFSDIESIFDWWDDTSKSLVDYEGF